MQNKKNPFFSLSLSLILAVRCECVISWKVYGLPLAWQTIMQSHHVCVQAKKRIRQHILPIRIALYYYYDYLK